MLEIESIRVGRLVVYVCDVSVEFEIRDGVVVINTFNMHIFSEGIFICSKIHSLDFVFNSFFNSNKWDETNEITFGENV